MQHNTNMCEEVLFPYTLFVRYFRYCDAFVLMIPNYIVYVTLLVFIHNSKTA